jgi:uncharacterized membrane protein
MRRKLLLVIVSALVFLWGAGLQAQTAKKSRATLTGIVLGENGKPVAHAAVSCQSSAGISPKVVYTDAHGRFKITGLREDNYDLRATAKGVYSDWEKNILVKRGQTKEVTITLQNVLVTPDSSAPPAPNP